MSSISTLIEASSSAAVLLGFFMVLLTPRATSSSWRLIGLTLSLADLRDTGVYYAVAAHVLEVNGSSRSRPQTNIALNASHATTTITTVASTSQTAKRFRQRRGRSVSLTTRRDITGILVACHLNSTGEMER